MLAVGPHGVVTMVREVKGAKDLVKHPGSYGAGDELIAAIAHDADRSRARLDTQRHGGHTPQGIADSLLKELARVPEILTQVPDDEAASVRVWLVAIADALLEHTKEPTDDEREVRNRIAELLAK